MRPVIVTKLRSISCILSVAGFIAFAQAGQTAETELPTGSKFSAVAESAAKAVVGISSEMSISNGDVQHPLEEFFGEEFFDRFFGSPGNGPDMRQFRQQAQGSGFVISSDGYILTNSHLVENAETISVQLNEQTYKGKVIGTDPETDLAVIKIEAKNLPTLELADSDQIEVGQWVLAVGSPFGLSHTVTAGIVSAKGRSGVGVAAYEDFLQTDAAINPGNSGGPLMNLDGKVVGINTAIISASGGNLGIGLAIPSNMAKNIYEQIRKEGKVVRGFLGITIQDLTPELAEFFDMKDTRGVLVPGITEGSAADKAGIQKDDIILELNGEPVTTADELRNRVAMLKPGTKAELLIFRDGERMEVTAQIGERPRQEELAKQREQKQDRGAQLGLGVQNLTDELAQRLGLQGMSGVVVTKVQPGSPAATAGIRPGMVITEVNRTQISDLDDFMEEINKAKEKESILLLVSTRTGGQYVVLNVPERK